MNNSLITAMKQFKLYVAGFLHTIYSLSSLFQLSTSAIYLGAASRWLLKVHVLIYIMNLKSIVLELLLYSPGVSELFVVWYMTIYQYP